MPITGRTPDHCFGHFRDYLAPLFTGILSRTAQLHYDAKGERRTLSFQEHGQATVPLDTHFGRMFFSFAQLLEAVKEKKTYRLATRQYWYRIQRTPALRDPAIIRWEYDWKFSADTDSHCRHHVQMPVSLALGNEHSLDLGKVHIPTGWVTIEEVLRFLIMELGIQPVCGAEWPQRLAESERAFFEDLTSKGYIV